MVRQVLIVRHLGGVLALSSYCSVRIETPLAGKPGLENDLSIASMGLTNSKLSTRALTKSFITDAQDQELRGEARRATEAGASGGQPFHHGPRLLGRNSLLGCFENPVTNFNRF